MLYPIIKFINALYADDPINACLLCRSSLSKHSPELLCLSLQSLQASVRILANVTADSGLS